MLNQLMTILYCIGVIAACIAAVAAVRCFLVVTDKESRYSILWYLDRLWGEADSRQQIALANLQDSVDFLIHKRDACRERFGRYPAPSSELIQEQFEARLRQAGWDFTANAEYPARLVWFVDSKSLINSGHTCRFYAFIQASDHDLHDITNQNRFDGCHVYGVVSVSVDESMRRWKEHGFDNQKRFELLDRHLHELIGSVENPREIPGPEFPRYQWPSGISQFDKQENRPCGTF